MRYGLGLETQWILGTVEGYEVLWRVEVRWRVGDAVVIKVGGGLEMQSSTVPQVSELRFGGGLEMQWICSRDAVDMQQRCSGFAAETQWICRGDAVQG